MRSGKSCNLARMRRADIEVAYNDEPASVERALGVRYPGRMSSARWADVGLL